MSKVQHIFRVFDALNVVKGIKAVGGPDHQTYYIESDVYAPDRRITPLILQPYVEVSDPNGVIPAGDKIGELSSASWYIGEAILANKITAKESEATLDTPFAIGENNALHVRKNSTKSILLIFEGEYLDIRKDKNIHISLTYTLTTTSNTEVKPAPKLMLSKPQSWKYCPLENQTKAVIEATVSQDSKLYRSAVQWVKVEGDKETLIGENDPFYIEGQNTDKLTINPSLMGSTLIRAKNHDEVFYNEVYGINPEWDHRMDEVMRNRNLFILNKVRTISYYIRPNSLLYATDGSTSAVYEVTKAGTYSISVAKETRFFRVGYSTTDILTGAASYELHDTFLSESVMSRTITIPDTAKYIVIQLPGNEFDKVIKGLKIEESSNPTPYTPAPEDLNGINFFQDKNINTSGLKFSVGERHWKLVGTSPLQPDIYDSSDTIILEEGKYTLSYEYRGVPSDVGARSQIRLHIDDSTLYYIKLPDLSSEWKKGHYTFTLEQARSMIGIGMYIHSFGEGMITDKEFELKGLKLSKNNSINYTISPFDLASDGILKGTYQSDIKFTRYFPNIESEIDFLTGDTLRAGMDTVKMKAVFKTNKEEIKSPEQYFDIKWYLDPVEAGGQSEYLGQGEFLEVPISKIPPKVRAIPFRLEYEFK